MANNLKKISQDQISNIRGVFFDIDDTITTDGKLTDEAYSALWALKAKGYKLVPVTGRPAAWCDHIIRYWPVDAVIGENGAFSFFMEDGVRKRIDTEEKISLESVKLNLEALKVSLEEKFTNIKFASDQNYREYDLAVDICEDVTPWQQNDINELITFCKKQGAHAKLSSIHVNIWFGNYDKAQGIKNWFSKNCPGVQGDGPRFDDWIFIGDSPNDAPMFEIFKKSVAVSNIQKYLKDLKHTPTWIMDFESGKGFCQFVDIMCSK